MAQVRPTSLYRLYDADDRLLYVGISYNYWTRFGQHEGGKAWWRDVTRTTVEHFASREAALDAERQAIVDEEPLHNIQHNGRKLGVVPAAAPVRGQTGEAGEARDVVEQPVPADLWTYQTRRYGTERTGELYLSPQVEGTAMSDDYLPSEISAGELFRRWRRRYGGRPGSVHWSVTGTGGTHESAPFCGYVEDFLSYYTWPVRESDGARLNWNSLPVLDGDWSSEGTKGGFFQEYTGWKPAPFQTSFDLGEVLFRAGIEGGSLLPSGFPLPSL